MARTKTSIAIMLSLTMAACAVDAGAQMPTDDPGATAPGSVPDSGDVTSAVTTPTDDPPATSSSPVYPTAHPRIYLTKNRARLAAALAAHTAPATRFKSMVDAWVGGSDIWGFGAWNAALMGQLTGTPTYCAKAVATVEAQVVAAEAKIAAGQAPDVASDSYLGIGDMIGDLALVYDWCYPQVSSSQRARWIAYANQAISNVWHPTTAHWGNATMTWSGWATNDPSDNYYYSFLRATMLFGLATRGESSQAAGFITEFRSTKILQQLVPTFDADLVGGASREGTGYGVAMRRLFELYDLWTSTTGEVLATKTPHTRASLLAMIHQILPTLDRVAPTGDLSRDSTAAFFDYHRHYLLALMSLFPTDTLAKRAKGLLAASSLPAMGSSFMYAYDFLYDNPALTAQPLTGLDTTYFAKGIGELYARSGWDTGATWVNMIAGPYTQSHAHQDQGSLMIYKGAWLAYDSVINSNSGLNQATTSHSLVRIDNGGTPIAQVANTISKLSALKKGTGYVYASADVTPAYNHNSAIQKVQREMLFVEPNVIIVFDRVQSSSSTAQTWQLATPVQPAISGNTATINNGGHQLAITRMEPSAATTSTYSFASGSDFNGGFRLDEHVAGGDNRYLHVLSVDGGATSSVASGSHGVTVHLANGQNVTINFNADAPGAVLTMNGTTTTLTATVQTLPQ